jgi:hypothetical protein
VLVLLGLLPAVTYALVGYALRPAGQVFAPLRLALVRAAVVIGGAAAVLVEALGAARALTRPAMAVSWSVAILLALAGAALRARRDRVGTGRHGQCRDRLTPGPDRRPGGLDLVGRVRTAWASAGRVERIMVVTLLGLFAAELLIAVLSPPNNYDSQTYHLPRIEHWVQQRDVGLFATRIHRQLTMAPGAEYLLLHLRLLTGGDALYNLLQFAAGLGCALVASRIAGQLGGSPRAQVLTAFVLSTTPIVALESTSTQTDLVVAAWTACVATLVLDEVRRRTRLPEVALLGTATGLTALTKENGLLAAGPLLLIWGVAQLRWSGSGGRGPGARVAALRGLVRTAGAAVAVLGLAAVIVGPFLLRIDGEYGNPLGPDYLRDSISMQRHDPASILVNALRIGHTALNTPAGPVNDVAARGIERLSSALGVDPDDQRITFWHTTFPATTWLPDEDKAAMPVEGVLVLLGAGFLLVRPGRRVPAGRTLPVRAYAAVFWLALTLYVATIKWQPWGNRLILYLLVLGAPLAGLWLDAVLRRAARPGRSAAGSTVGSDPARPVPAVARSAADRRTTAGEWADGAPPVGGDKRPNGDHRLVAGRDASGGHRIAERRGTGASHRAAAGRHGNAGWWERAGTRHNAGRWRVAGWRVAGRRVAGRRAAAGHRVAAWAVVAALTVSGCAAWLSVGYGWPRRLVGSGSVFTTGEMPARFQRRAQWLAEYEWAAAAVRASGARRVGLVQSTDTWEYPWWLLLPGRDIEAEQSLMPDLPPVRPDQVDALVCVETAVVCRYYVPVGWQLHMRDTVGYALPAGH